MPLINPKVGDPNVVQSVTKILSTDKTTTSTSYSNLLSLPITTEGATHVLVYVSYCVTFTPAAADDIRLRLMVDGSVVLYSAEESFDVAQSGSIVYRAASLSSGAHTIDVQWRRPATSGTVRCRPSVSPEGISIFTMEVRV